MNPKNALESLNSSPTLNAFQERSSTNPLQNKEEEVKNQLSSIYGRTFNNQLLIIKLIHMIVKPLFTLSP